MLSLRVGWVALFIALVASAVGQDVNLVKEILIRGNKRVSREAVLSSMTTKVGSFYTQQKLDADRQALESTGFFSAVDVRGVPIESSTNWQVLVNVQEFPEIKEIRITGNSVIKTEDIINTLTPGLRPGKIYNERELPPSAENIVKLYAERGYYGRVIDFGLLPDSPSTLNIQILETRVGKVEVQGNKSTKNKVFTHLIHTKAGELFNANKWLADIRRLYNTQWFDSIRPSEDLTRELGKADLLIDLKEARTGTFNIGVQLDPRNTLAGVVRFSESNLGGTGQGVDLDYTQTTQGGGASVALSYTNPFYDRHDTTFRASVFSRVVYRFQGGLFGSNNTSFTNDSQYYERRNGASAGFSRPLTDALSVGVSLRYEKVSTENLQPILDNFGNPINDFIQQDGTVSVLTFGGTLNRRDRDVDSTRGDYTSLQIEPGFSDITKEGGLAQGSGGLGQHTFVRSQFEYRRYFSQGKALTARDIDASRNVVAVRAKLGSISGTLPFFEQFFLGGSQSLRGYQEDRFWGKNQFLATLEYRHPLQKSFSLVGFIDYGGAWGGYGSVNEYTQSDTPQFHLGYGPGLSFRTPLGNIQLFLGFDENGKSRTHFLIGNSF